MCGRSFTKRKPRFGHRRDHPVYDLDRGGSWGHHGGSGRFFGLDAEEMAPRAQVAASVAVLAPVVLSGIVLAFTPVWWIFTTYFWVAFPAVGLLTKGITGLSRNEARTVSARSSSERELLESR